MLQPDMQRRALLEDIADGYFETDLEGRLSAVNGSLCRILACADPVQLMADQRPHFVDAQTLKRLRQVFRQVRETGQSAQSVECPVIRGDGERRTLELSVSLMRSAQEPVGFCGIVRDVTEHVKTAAALHQRLSQLSLLQQVDVELNQTLALDSVLVVALNAALLVSSAEAGFIGLIEHDQIRLARSVGAFPQTHMPLDSGIVARVLRQQSAEHVAEVEADRDYSPGLPATRALIAIPLVAHGKVVGVLDLETRAPERFTPDVFEFTQRLGVRIAAAIENASLYETLQSQLAELRSLYAQVSELEQLKTHMIRLAAHDLRSPLAIIASYIELLNQDLAPHYGEMDAVYVSAIRQSVARMTQMTADILSLERLHEHSDITLMRVQLGALLQRTFDEYAEQSHQRGQQTRLSIEPVVVYGNAAELHEALANLIGNAVKYTPSGGSIETRLQRDGDFALVEIVDSGYGIPEDQQQQLFQPFHRVKTRETYAIDGTGLGLYLVKTIIERHGGSVHFRSAQGKGSLFGFRLPLAKPGE